jgi:tetratricopeptide (TPR) repeat protein
LAKAHQRLPHITAGSRRFLEAGDADELRVSRAYRKSHTPPQHSFVFSGGMDRSGPCRGHGAPASEGDREKEKAVANDGGWDRRSLLRGAAVVAGAAATAPLLGKTATAQADGSDADALFKAGKFEQAGRAYEEILKTDPTNLNAARQRGYVGLLSNRFPEAEKYLTMALKLAPDDKDTNQLLGDCYLRQDKLSLSKPYNVTLDFTDMTLYIARGKVG